MSTEKSENLDSGWPTLTHSPPPASALETGRRKRGRPRKYRRSVNLAPAQTVAVSPQPTEMAVSRGPGEVGCPYYAIIVQPREDVLEKIISFFRNVPQSVCILSATGCISKVSLRTSGGMATYEKQFRILSISGSVIVLENGERTTCGLTVSLAGEDFHVLTGRLTWNLIAASTVQVITGDISDEKWAKSSTVGSHFSELVELQERQRQRQRQEQFDGLKDLRSEKQKLAELINDHNVLKCLCDEKDTILQAVMLEKKSLEEKISKLENLAVRQRQEQLDDLKDLRSEKQKLSELMSDHNRLKCLYDEKDTILRAVMLEKKSLEEKISKLENLAPENDAQMEILEKRFEQERKTFKLQVSELERKLREREEDMERKDVQTAAKLAELHTLYKEEQILRKHYFNVNEDRKGKIRVYCRIRPLNVKEIAKNERIVIRRVDESTIEHQLPDNEVKRYSFNQVFDANATQEDVFQDTRYLVQSAVDGVNVCIFAYGQTRSGKTFTINGTKNHPGITSLSLSELFKILERERKKFSFSLEVYMVELYMDKFVDLLLPKNTRCLKLDAKQDSMKRVYVENTTVLPVSTLDEIKSVMQKGWDQRSTSRTDMNEKSSRSHLVFSIIIKSTDRQTQSVTIGKLSFVDLAGSERRDKSSSSDTRGEEAKSINSSLSTLQRVIVALTCQQTHIPYRDNKLTKLMQDSIGGNAKTLMFVNVSPAESDTNESSCSLEYASKVRTAQNKDVANKEKD